MYDVEEDNKGGTRVKKLGKPPISYFQTISGSMKRSFGKTLLSAAGCTSTTGVSSQANRGITAYLESYQLVDPKN